MWKSIGNRRSQKGFTLIEMAIVLVILGTMIASALAVYKVYVEQERYDQTEKTMISLASKIGDFRSVYGRYPCPGESTAVQGAAAYGHEEADCVAANYGTAGNCAGGICTATSASATPIVIGSVPYKALGMMEEDMYDSYGNRITYAVSALLTSRATFDMTQGALSIVDEAGSSVVSPQDRAHFMAISHGPNGIGAFTRAGVLHQNCAVATAAEAENCDNDNTFRFMPKATGFDDRAKYFTPGKISYWEKATSASQNIFLRDGDSIAIGAASNFDLTGAQTVEVRTSSPSSGVAWAQNSNILTNSICNNNPLDIRCFAPPLFGGSNPLRIPADQAGGGAGVYCPAGSFITQIGRGYDPSFVTCSPEVFVSCPNTHRISGISNTGRLVCRDVSMPTCQARTVTTACGESRNLPAGFFNATQNLLSGQCHYFGATENLTAANWQAWLATPRTDAEIQTYIATLNSADRVQQACDTTQNRNLPGSALVRETYRCVTNANTNVTEWSNLITPPQAAPNDTYKHERRGFNDFFPADVFTSGGASMAEVSGPAYSVPHDLNHSDDTHDCWCREDWRMATSSCSGGYSGSIRNIQKHRCPSTRASWQTVYQDMSQCACAPGSATNWITCNQHFNVQPGFHLDGWVSVTRPTICVNGVNVVDNNAPPTYNTSGCSCPARAQVVSTTPCPPGTTNSFLVPGESTPRTGVLTVSINRWICPGAASGNPQPGYWQNNIIPPNIPACTCDSNYYEIEHESCDAGMEGFGRQYKKEWDCNINGFEPPEDWELISEDCNTCTWKSVKTSYLESNAMGKRINTACACGDSTVTLCYDDGPGGQYEIWPSCACSGD